MIVRMMKRLLRIGLILAGLLGGQSVSFSEFPTRPSILAHAGGAFHEENYVRPGFETGFGFSYPLGEALFVSFEFCSWNCTTKKSVPGKLYNGRLTLSPILLTLQYEFSPTRFFFPYAFVGGAYIFTRFKIGSYVSIPEVKIDQTIENGLAFYFGIGARLSFSKAWSFVSEVSYLMRKAPAKTIIHDMNRGLSSEDFVGDLRSVILKFGLKYLF
jgi:hypothetical protein